MKRRGRRLNRPRKKRRRKMNLVGKTLRSKINGALFYVAELFTEYGREFYKVCEPGTSNYTAIERGWFELGYMQNLEMVKEN